METVNEALETVIDAALLDAYVNKAQSAYKLYKSAAMESAANCYLVWYYAASEQADQFANAWFDKKVAAYNAKVDDFNNGLPTLEARMKAYVSGELTDIDATEMAKLKEYISYSHDDWGKASKLKAEAREGASPFTIVVKFVFEFDRASDASNVSRYAKVLEYIDQHRDQLDSMPNSVFKPYASIGTNLLFFEKGQPTKEIWYYEHQVPEGQKAYSMTKPIRLEHFQSCIDWWGGAARAGREEGPQAWKVSIDEVKARGYNLDFKNPHSVDADHGDPAELLAALNQAEAKTAELRDQLKAILAEALAR